MLFSFQNSLISFRYAVFFSKQHDSILLRIILIYTQIGCIILLSIFSVYASCFLFRFISRSKCRTICSYVPFSRYAWLIDFFRWGGIFAYRRLSIICGAASPNAFSALYSKSSRKSGSFWFSGWNISLLILCLAEALDSGFTYFLRKTTKMSSSVVVGVRCIILKVFSASPLRWA